LGVPINEIEIAPQVRDHDSAPRSSQPVPSVTQPTRTIELEHFGRVSVVWRACPLCGKDNDAAPASRYSEGVWAIKDCQSCRFTYIDAAPDYAAQFVQMPWDCTTKIEEKRRAKIRPISYRVSKWTRFRLHLLPRRTMESYITARIPTGNIVDLGCGEGGALLRLADVYTPFGIEISSKLAEKADRLFRGRGGRAINASSLDGLRRFPDDFFAAATLRSYLEHEQHPLPVLHELHRVLAPSGFAVVKVPNYGSLNRLVLGRRWTGFRYPDHLNYFTPATLRAMAARAGFVTQFGLTGRIPTNDNMWAVLAKASPAK
jgi:SAM-dependent methyltransferase